MKLSYAIREMRNAIDGIDLALHGIDHLDELRTLWQDGRDDLTIKVEMDLGTFRQICDALDECNRVINSPEYAPAELEI